MHDSFAHYHDSNIHGFCCLCHLETSFYLHTESKHFEVCVANCYKTDFAEIDDASVTVRAGLDKKK